VGSLSGKFEIEFQSYSQVYCPVKDMSTIPSSMAAIIQAKETPTTTTTTASTTTHSKSSRIASPVVSGLHVQKESQSQSKSHTRHTTTLSTTTTTTAVFDDDKNSDSSDTFSLEDVSSPTPTQPPSHHTRITKPHSTVAAHHHHSSHPLLKRAPPSRSSPQSQSQLYQGPSSANAAKNATISMGVESSQPPPRSRLDKFGPFYMRRPKYFVAVIVSGDSEKFVSIHE
jgi:hypothetical protein